MKFIFAFRVNTIEDFAEKLSDGKIEFYTVVMYVKQKIQS